MRAGPSGVALLVLSLVATLAASGCSAPPPDESPSIQFTLAVFNDLHSGGYFRSKLTDGGDAVHDEQNYAEANTRMQWTETLQPGRAYAYNVHYGIAQNAVADGSSMGGTITNHYCDGQAGHNVTVEIRSSWIQNGAPAGAEHGILTCV